MGDVLVLCYHAVSERWPAKLSLTPERLERQLRWVVAAGYRGATFHEAVTAPPAAKTVAVTFDDAYRSVLELAFPILSRLRLPATVFVPTAFPGSDDPMAWPGIDEWLDGPHRAELQCMSWEELGGLASEGWEVGSHTRSHPMLTQIDDAALSRELSDSRSECEDRLGRPCRTIAYPYGDLDGRVAAAARDAGYDAGATLRRDRRDPRPLEWPRVGVYNADSYWRFRLKVAPATRGRAMGAALSLRERRGA